MHPSKHQRILTIIALRKEGKTYAAIGRAVGLSAARVEQIVAKHDPELKREYRDRMALRDHRIIRLREQGLTQAAIGRKVGLSAVAVGMVLARDGPELTGWRARKFPFAPRWKDNRRAHNRWYYHHVAKPIRARAQLALRMMESPEALTFKGLATQQGRHPTVQTVPIDLVRRDPESAIVIGSTEAEDQSLRSSIQRFGVLSPLVVSSAGDGTYLIIDGLRRYRIARELGLKSVACTINPEADAAARERIRLQLESTFRPLTAAEHERLVRRLQAMAV